MKYKIITIAYLLCSISFANNLTVTGPVILVDQDETNNYTYINFSVSWDNSWRLPTNYDAIWVFAKYRKMGESNWNHASLSTGNNDHTVLNDNSVSAEFKVGQTNSVGKGVFIQRAANGSGSINWEGVKLRWLYGDDGVVDNDSVTVKVFAIEMVYIPQGSFFVGDGIEDSSRINGHFHDAGTIDTPFLITSENAITLGGTTSGSLGNNNTFGEYTDSESPVDDFDDINTQTLPAAYPKGYNAFYMMKYEITQGQYTSFLNCLTRLQQDSRTEASIIGTIPSGRYVMTNSPNVENRSSIKCLSSLPSPPSQVSFYLDLNNDESAGDGQYIACNYLHQLDGFAFADWAGLRPVSELEFEKACRGNNNSVVNEFSWGNTSYFFQSYTLQNSGVENELISNQSNTLGNAAHAHTSENLGPLRVGIFATSSTNRTTAGASFYGVMELSGNLWEQLIPLGNPIGRAFTGSHGDGILSTNGNATNSDWPGFNNGDVNEIENMNFRGSSWDWSYLYATVSNRFIPNGFAGSWNGSEWIISRSKSDGMRFVRTAP